MKVEITLRRDECSSETDCQTIWEHHDGACRLL